MVPHSMTWIDPRPGFLGRDIFRHLVSQKRHGRAIITIEHQ